MKNKLYITVNLRIIWFLIASLQIGSIFAAFESKQHEAGKERIFQVMYQGPGGIEEVNKKTLFAETKNLSSDLNLSEISTRFGCKTQMGQAFIAHTLANPISSLDTNNTIQNRRNLIQLLIDHPELQEKFDALIKKAIEYEEIVMKFMQKRFVMDAQGNPIKLFQQFMRRNLFAQLWEQGSAAINVVTAPQEFQEKLKPMQESGAVVLESAQSTLSSISGLVLDNLFISGLLATGTAFLAKKTSSISSKKLSIPAQALLAGSLLVATTQTPGMWDFGKSSQAALWIAWSTAVGGYNLYNHYTEALDIRNSLYALNQLIYITKEIEAVCNEYNIAYQFSLSSIKSDDGVELLKDLEHDRYTNKDSALFLTPLVHSFVFDVYEHDINFAPVYASIAQMDAYLAISKKMTESQNTDRKISFVEFLDDPKPTINAKEFWNMLVSKDNIVTNSIFENKNIILTGSNEGGKTTTIRAILQNIVLAQTFGIAAASEFKLTHFDVIHSYLNVSDDILNGKSRFASELKQAQDILIRIKNLKPTEKFFFAFDELFTGTNGEDGAECAYRFIDNIASYKNIQFIYATHFNVLKTIGSKNPACVNYKIEPPLRDKNGEFIRDNDGQLVYPYKLSPGANDINVAMDRAKDAGIFT